MRSDDEPLADYAQPKSGRLKEMERSITEDNVFRWLLDRNDVLTNA